MLLLDNQVPYSSTRRWPSWTREGRAKLPEPWPRARRGARRLDGSERELRVRAISLDPLDQTIVMEIAQTNGSMISNVASEVHTLSMRMYFHAELLLLARGRRASSSPPFTGDHQREPATADSEFVVYTAERI